MELNGVANMMIILDQAEAEGTIDKSTLLQLREQLDTMLRYMIAYQKTVIAVNGEVYWHEVRDNPEKYGRER